MRDRTTAPPADHAGHDELLVVAYASDDLAGAELAAARALVERCDACALLAADVRAIRAGTAALAARPAPRPRDFRLTSDDAARLRPRGWLERLAGALLGAEGPGRPIAVALTTLGLAGLLVGNAPGLPGSPTILSKVGSAAEAPGAYLSTPVPREAGTPSPAPSAQAAGGEAPGGPTGAGPSPGPSGPAASGTGSEDLGSLDGATPAPPGSPAAGDRGAAGPPASTPASGPAAASGGVAGAGGPSGPADPLVAGSVVALGLGLGLFLLRRLAGSRFEPS